MKCLRCNGEMEHLGHESLQLGQYGFLPATCPTSFPARSRSIFMPASPAANWSFIARTHPVCPSG